MKNAYPQELSFGEEMYEGLKGAVKHISKYNMIANTSIDFNDNEMKLIIKEPVEEWYLISMGYHACRIMNNLPNN